MGHIGDRLIEEGRRKRTALVVGLDPDLRYIPDAIRQGADPETGEGAAEAIYAFNRIVIDAVADHVVAVKPQLAYYEIYGASGIGALERTIRYARSKGLLVLNDAKRGDIGPTSAAYARAFLGDGPIAGDMVTVNPFLGSDGYMPFIEAAETAGKVVFVLLKTSNPSSGELQDVKLDGGGALYMKLAEELERLAARSLGTHGYSCVGAVVGGTYPEEARAIRAALKSAIFLVPGYGAQGGSAEALRPFFDVRGEGAVVSSSRAILYAYRSLGDHWSSLSEAEIGRAIGEEAAGAKEAINAVRGL
ncbi:orotidine-5'-phosphate decarboxylase [Paenibacillus methanolicus]|uniref:Orotidine 5'-phosphate decarboxylase n=1 Tax=Paenibacillus methanolicus TaxID=582686 RepID=A0A5S5BS09_9BACL|nr:orotidine-5'-phosphate decarboxylase [Paenibacillus methanolicus]TYP68363.1 orotidine-5'-phosphate decarboxylase [Paenibacillus methanolicus]